MSASIIKINSSTDVIPLGVARQGPSDRRIDNNFKNNLKPRNDHRPKPNVPKHYPYFGDQFIVPRVKQYLEDHSHDIRIDFEDMVDTLQSKYREYSKRKRSAFKGLVDKAYSVVLNEFRVHPNNAPNNQDVDIYSGSSDEEYLDHEDLVGNLLNDSGNKQLMSMYAAQSKKHSHPKLDGQELINISSSDDEDGDKTKSKKLDAVSASSEDNALPQPSPLGGPAPASGSMANPAFNGTAPEATPLPPTPTTPAADRPRKRKASDMASGGAVATGKKKREVLPPAAAAPASATEQRLTFKDFGGNAGVLAEVCKLLVHMRHPEVYRRIGVRPPRGFLLHGPPGCGKTLLAQAIAGELNVPLMKVASTELVAGVSGESEERIRKLFEEAAQAAPCVLFLDEVDAITPNRHTAQREMERRIVAQLLTCLDDLSQKENGDQVLVIGATNRPDALDPALRRAGRFDREVSLGIPDAASRAAILRVVCSRLRLAPDVCLTAVAANTPGFVGADLTALTREAAMAAINRVFAQLKRTQADAQAVAEGDGSGDKASGGVAVAEKVPAERGEVGGGEGIGDEPRGRADDVVGDEKASLETLTSTSDQPIKGDVAMEVCEDVGEEPKAASAASNSVDGVAPKVEKEAEHSDEKKVEQTDEKKAEQTDEKKAEQTNEKKAEQTGVKKVEQTNEKKVEREDDKKAEAEETVEKKVERVVENKAERVDENKAELAGGETTAERIVDKKAEQGGGENGAGPALDEMISWLHDCAPLSPSQLEALHVEKGDFDEALKCVQPSAKREGFATVPDVTWDDVGSLQDIRDELQMAILAPVRHPAQFASLGVSTATGVLLCGPPGCGKTLLAKAVANEAGVNFISVKGPELLNMYVGESERAVRQCFQRARNSAPCVIFFDELDALCPKRAEAGEGGASMRVVNQMLTEMDGYEGRKGVYLMAATNRPDIVDPAVLRPGRLDKILYVGLPTGPDRVLILQALTKQGTRPRLAADVDLRRVGESGRCADYTGADLAALVREAGVEALREFLAASDPPQQLTVADKHFQRALDKIRPSVSEKDRKYYEKLREVYTAVPSK